MSPQDGQWTYAGLRLLGSTVAERDQWDGVHGRGWTLATRDERGRDVILGRIRYHANVRGWMATINGWQWMVPPNRLIEHPYLSTPRLIIGNVRKAQQEVEKVIAAGRLLAAAAMAAAEKWEV